MLEQFNNLRLKLLHAITFVLFVGFIFFVQQSTAFGTPDTPEVIEVKASLARYYQLLDTPVAELNIELFSEVLLNSEDYQLSDQRKEFLSRAAEFAKSRETGYLTAMQAKYYLMQQNEKLKSSLLDKARSENRQVTEDEWKELEQLTGTQGNAYIYYSESQTATQLQYQSIAIDGEKAIVRYDDQAAVQEAILKHVNGHWFIVDIRPIWVHF